MSVPPKYPRVAHVGAGPAVTSDDAVLTAGERRALLGADVVVEEKLDGMNVVVWVEDGVPRVATRGGADSSDRSGERGRLRSWALVRADELQAALGGRFAVYGEWLRRRHAVAYEQLPSELVAFDVLDRASGAFLAPAARDVVLRAAGLAVPPERFRGRLGALEALDALLGPSAFGASRAEGLVVRSLSPGPPRAAKHVDPAWSGIGRAAWAGTNGLASPPHPALLQRE